MSVTGIIIVIDKLTSYKIEIRDNNYYLSGKYIEQTFGTEKVLCKPVKTEWIHVGQQYSFSILTNIEHPHIFVTDEVTKVSYIDGSSLFKLKLRKFFSRRLVPYGV